MNIPQNVSPNENYIVLEHLPLDSQKMNSRFCTVKLGDHFLQMWEPQLKLNHSVISLSLDLSRANNILLLLTHACKIAQHGWMLHCYCIVILEIFRNTHCRWSEPARLSFSQYKKGLKGRVRVSHRFDVHEGKVIRYICITLLKCFCFSKVFMQPVI
jgi:hypothetical protein